MKIFCIINYSICMHILTKFVLVQDFMEVLVTCNVLLSDKVDTRSWCSSQNVTLYVYCIIYLRQPDLHECIVVCQYEGLLSHVNQKWISVIMFLQRISLFILYFERVVYIYEEILYYYVMSDTMISIGAWTHLLLYMFQIVKNKYTKVTQN